MTLSKIIRERERAIKELQGSVARTTAIIKDQQRVLRNERARARRAARHA